MTEKNIQKSTRGGFHYAYAIVASCVAITFLPCALVLSCAGIFFTPVSQYFSVATAEFTLYFSVLNIAQMLTLPIAGKLLSRLDARVVLSVAVALCSAGLVGMSLCQAMWQFYVCGAVLGVGVCPLIYLSVPTLVNAWCVKRVGFFVGLCMAFTGIGGVVFNPVGTALINSGAEGWRTAYLVFAAIVAVGTLPFTLFVVRSRPEDKGLLPYGADEIGEKDAEAVELTGVPAAQAMRMPAFFALAAFCGVITLNQTIYQFLAGYAQSFADTMPAIAAASGVVASAAMGGQAVGKVLLGAINDRSVHLGVFVGICAGAAGVTLMWLFPGTLALLLVGAFTRASRWWARSCPPWRRCSGGSSWTPLAATRSCLCWAMPAWRHASCSRSSRSRRGRRWRSRLARNNAAAKAKPSLKPARTQVRQKHADCVGIIRSRRFLAQMYAVDQIMAANLRSRQDSRGARTQSTEIRHLARCGLHVRRWTTAGSDAPDERAVPGAHV